MKDSRLSTGKQIRTTKKLLKERQKWLVSDFLPRLQQKFPEFSDYTLTASISPITREDLIDIEPDEYIDSTPLTKFEIILAKKVEHPDKRISRQIHRTRNYRKILQHRHPCKPVLWNDNLLLKIEEINNRIIQLFTKALTTSELLREFLESEYQNGRKEFADFDIEASVVYTNHQIFPYTDGKTSNLLREITNFHTFIPTIYLNSSNTQSVDLRETLYLSMDDWNIELFEKVPKCIPINYYMHCLFVDGYTYNLNDLQFMNPEDFQVQTTISTWDWMMERENR